MSAKRETLRVVFVGHIDHGKSSLIGRLLTDCGAVNYAARERVSNACERLNKSFEHAFLFDALEEEQGRGITLETARVFFRSATRDYILSDAPGHGELLRNMATGAARADAAVLVIDAEEGIRDSSRLHSAVLSILGCHDVVVAINKMDRVGYSEAHFRRIQNDARDLLADNGLAARYVVPTSAHGGDFVSVRSEKLSWSEGPTLFEAIECLEDARVADEQPLRLSVQDVYCSKLLADGRPILAGTIAAGKIEVDDEIVFAPSGRTARVRSIESYGSPTRAYAVAGQAIGITLEERCDVGRGELISHAAGPSPAIGARLRANVVWLGPRPLRLRHPYRLRLASADTEVFIEELDEVARGHGANRLATVVVRARQAIAFDVAAKIEATGRFVLVDDLDIAGGGTICEVLS